MPPIGQDTLTAITRHYILPQITDNAYLKNNALLYRMIRSGKRTIQGGTHIEIPVQYRADSTGGSFTGYDILDTAPQDNIKNAWVGWKQYYESFAIDDLTLIKADSTLSIANLLQHQGQTIRMNMANRLAQGMFNDGIVDPKGLDGLGSIIGTANNYAGLDRTTEAYWRATVDSATTTLSLTKMRGLFGDATIGGTHPTIWFGNGVNYNRLYALNLSTPGYGVQYVREPGGHDEVLAQAGFTNLIFENVPFVRDDNVVSERVLALNEENIEVVVSPRSDFTLEPFQKPWNQQAYVSTLHWAGNIICTNPRSQAAFTNLSA